MDLNQTEFTGFRKNSPPARRSKLTTSSSLGFVYLLQEAGNMDEESQLENGVESGKATDRQLRLRVCVMTEILKTEKDYVGSLKFLKSVS